MAFSHNQNRNIVNSDFIPAFSIFGRICQNFIVAKSIYSANYERFVQVLGRVRSDAGLSQEALAKKMKMSQSTVSDLLRGQRRLDVIEWISYCKACGITPERFLEELAFVTRSKD
ncbi:helix-turn-helix transcriptional regulator [Luteolibacter ambystomatis]|uniref:Helix-turn-helix transcriptional regulator n=1 Tax=Luteolibacter ambystomatis TaxID=2824561 RepID=A0A975J2E8_9BACT|nr:helix-turn-helix transcriptional regulator [Luteolibacter ambystomatis]QUE52798.1 helix-turn-helix transcriptional regulator [Luteolibacter ambystomatis]